MTPEQRLVRIAEIYDPQRKNADGSITSGHARHNLYGALYDTKRKRNVMDAVSQHTIRRVIRQLAEIEPYIAEELKAIVPKEVGDDTADDED